MPPSAPGAGRKYISSHSCRLQSGGRALNLQYCGSTIFGGRIAAKIGKTRPFTTMVAGKMQQLLLLKHVAIHAKFPRPFTGTLESNGANQATNVGPVLWPARRVHSAVCGRSLTSLDGGLPVRPVRASELANYEVIAGVHCADFD